MKENRKIENMTVRVTEAELSELEEKAAKAGMKKSDYIRAAIKKSEVYPMEEVQKLVVQVAKVGNNLNQIARVLNTNPNSSASANLKLLVEDFGAIKECLWSIEVEICR